MTSLRALKMLVVLAAAFSLVGCNPEKDKTTHMPGPLKGPPGFARAVNTPIDPILQATAKKEILTALHSDDEIIRSHALEILADLKMSDWNPEIIDALRDRSTLVRKAAALTAGQLKLADAAPRLPELLEAEVSAKPEDLVGAKQERLAAIFALHQLGNYQYSHELEESAFDRRPQIQGETAFLLGLIGDKSAVPLLAEMMLKSMNVNVRLQIAESLWRLGDERGEDALVQGTVSAYASDQMIALLGLAEPHDTRLLGNVESGFTSDYLEVRLVTARAAGMLGSDDGYGVANQGAKSVDPRHRALAALAYGSIGRSDSQPRLAKLIKDSYPDVRIAAAEGVLEVGIAGVR